MNNVTQQIDWVSIHEQARKLDDARRGAGIQIARTVTDPFGGSYFGHWYEQQGLAGLASIRSALETITQAAWALVHEASGRVRKEQERGIAGRWVVSYQHGASWIPLTDRRNRMRSFATHRGAAIVAGRMHPRGIIESGDDVLARRIYQIHNEVRVAVNTMLAARGLYDALCRTGIIVPTAQTITSGHDYKHIHLSGLAWLAGESRESEAMTVEQCIRFVSGESAGEAFGPQAHRVGVAS